MEQRLASDLTRYFVEQWLQRWIAIKALNVRIQLGKHFHFSMGQIWFRLHDSGPTIWAAKKFAGLNQVWISSHSVKLQPRQWVFESQWRTLFLFFDLTRFRLNPPLPLLLYPFAKLIPYFTLVSYTFRNNNWFYVIVYSPCFVSLVTLQVHYTQINLHSFYISSHVCVCGNWSYNFFFAFRVIFLGIAAALIEPLSHA